MPGMAAREACRFLVESVSRWSVGRAVRIAVRIEAGGRDDDERTTTAGGVRGPGGGYLQ